MCSEGRNPQCGPIPGLGGQPHGAGASAHPRPHNTDHWLFCERAAPAPLLKKNALKGNPVHPVLTSLGPSPVWSDGLADPPAWMLQAPCLPAVTSWSTWQKTERKTRPCSFCTSFRWGWRPLIFGCRRIQQDMAAFIACESCPSFTGEKKHLNKRKRKDLMRPGMVLSSHSRAPGFCRRWRWDKGQLSTNDLHLAAAKMKVPSVLSLRQLPHCSLMNGGSTKHGHLEGWALWDVGPCGMLTQAHVHRSKAEGRDQLLEGKCWTCLCTEFAWIPSLVHRVWEPGRKETREITSRWLGASQDRKTSRRELTERGWQRGEIGHDTKEHSLVRKRLLSSHHVPGAVLGAGNRVVNRRHKSCPKELTSCCSAAGGQRRSTYGDCWGRPVPEKAVWAGKAQWGPEKVAAHCSVAPGGSEASATSP